MYHFCMKTNSVAQNCNYVYACTCECFIEFSKDKLQSIKPTLQCYDEIVFLVHCVLYRSTKKSIECHISAIEHEIIITLQQCNLLYDTTKTCSRNPLLQNVLALQIRLRNTRSCCKNQQTQYINASFTVTFLISKS